MFRCMKLPFSPQKTKFLIHDKILLYPCRGGRVSRASFSTTLERQINVDLAFDVCIPPNGNKHEGGLVMLHGLFGSKRNWATLTKAFCKELNIPVYALDLRNHGTSPHLRPMTYSHMAEDVLHFIRTHSLTGVHLLGHSMGGKAAMSVALHPSLSELENRHVLSSLIVADVAPVRTQLSPKFTSYVKAMKDIEELGIKSRKEAASYLENYEEDQSVRSFLLTNLKSMTKNEPNARFRVPLDILDEAIPELGSFPYAPEERKWEGKTLFIKGSKSAYINHHGMPIINGFFPNMKLDTLDTGHWVHGERPGEFKEIVTNFIKEADS